MKKKIKLMISMGSIGLILGIIVVVLIITRKPEPDGYDLAAEGLKKEFNADIIIYGEEIAFRENVDYRRIDKISEETLNSSAEHGYRAILLLDDNGKMSITDDELLLIKSYVEEKGYDMVYIGTQYLDDLVRLGFTVGVDEGARSLGYIGSTHAGKEVQQNEYGNLYAMHGIWTEEDLNYIKSDKELMQRVTISMMYDWAKEAASAE